MLILALARLPGVPASKRPSCVILGLLAIPLGFAIVFARERRLERTGRRPLDKPTTGTMVLVGGASAGLLSLIRLWSAAAEYAVYGAFLGLIFGLFLSIGRDIERLRPSGSRRFETGARPPKG